MSLTEHQPADAIKQCCATAYQHDAVALVLGESYHPGGLALTRHLVRALELRAGQRVLDVASGPGATAFALATEFGLEVDGVDFGGATVARANEAATERGLNWRVRFHQGDAERIPLPDAAVAAVVCECAFCTFPDKATAAREMARVLEPGARVGITDVVLDPARLHPELATLAGWVACIADARPLGEYVDVLERAGLRVTLTEDHDEALVRMVEQIDARLRALRMVKVAVLDGVDFDLVLDHVSRARRAVDDGVVGYALLVAEKP